MHKAPPITGRMLAVRFEMFRKQVSLASNADVAAQAPYLILRAPEDRPIQCYALAITGFLPHPDWSRMLFELPVDRAGRVALFIDPIGMPAYLGQTKRAAYEALLLIGECLYVGPPKVGA